MPNPFSRSLRSLEVDSFRRWLLGVASVSALLAAWTAWLVLARVSVYEVTASARLEVSQAVHSVDSSVVGRIAAVHMRLGQEVHAGDVLVELESDAERLALQQEQASLTSLSGQLAALHEQIQAEERALAGAQGASRASLDEARARVAEAEITGKFATEDLERKTRLRAAGQLPEADYSKARFDSERQKATVDTLRAGLKRLESEQQVDEGTHAARLSELRREAALEEGQKAASEAQVARLQSALDKRSIRAPVEGRIAELSDLQAGAVVREAERLAAVLPPGELRVVAYFEPLAALGRIRAGQRAQLRLDGFPWTQYGSVPAQVQGVATEVRDGRIRVELSLQPQPGSAIPLQHGLTGTLEVEVEQASPATLLLRAAGKLVTGPATGGTPAGP